MDKESDFNIFIDCLLQAKENIKEEYFYFPVAELKEIIYRERVYCYELYHQLKKLLPIDYPFTLNGEIHKIGHPLISTECGKIMPDFLVHKPGNMGENDNLVVMEVKSINGIDFRKERGFLKDLTTINCLTNLENGYYKGIILIYGNDTKNIKPRIEEYYFERCKKERVLLLYHEIPTSS